MGTDTKESDWAKVCNREMTHGDWAPEHARRMVRGKRVANDPIGGGKNRRTPDGYLRILRRRCTRLKWRIERADTEHKDGDFDRAEYHALVWAIQSLETVHDVTVRAKE